MWVNEISIDKKYQLEYDYLINRLNKINNLSYTKETSKDRYICSLATTDENKEYVKKHLFDIVSNIILVFIKRRLVFGKLQDITFTKVAIFSSIIHFDTCYEKRYLLSKLEEISDYNIDAIVNFRLKKLKRNWQELKALTEDLLIYADDGDLTYITSVMNNSSKDKVSEVSLASSGGKIRLFSSSDKFEILPIYANNYYNILDKIISINPKTINLQKIALPHEMESLLKKILLVKYT